MIRKGNRHIEFIYDDYSKLILYLSMNINYE